MYFKFLLIYSYLIVNSASFPSLNYGRKIGPQYRAPNFKSTPPRSEVQKDRPYVKQQPYNPNFNVPQQPKPAILYPSPAPKPVVRNDWPYARQPAYNPHFKVVSPGPPPTPEVQKDRPYVKQQPYNPNFNVDKNIKSLHQPQQPKPAILYPSPTPRPVVQSKWPPYNAHINSTPKPVIQNDWLYTKQPAYNPHFKMPPTPTPASRNLGSNQRQPPHNPHFKELTGQTMQNNGPTKPPNSTNQNHLFNIKPPAYNSHFVPPTPAKRNLSSNQTKQPHFSPHFNKVTGPTILNQGSMQRQPRQNPLMPETSTIKSHVLNSMSTLYPLMTTAHQSNNNHGNNVGSKFAGDLGAFNTFVKQFTKNHNSTNDKQTFENPILLSTDDSEVMDLINSYSPKDSVSGNTSTTFENPILLSTDDSEVMDLINSYSPKDSNPFSSKESLQKGLISNKLPAVHRYNLQTKQFYKGKPFILVTIVISSVVAMTALIGGIIFCSKKKN